MRENVRDKIMHRVPFFTELFYDNQQRRERENVSEGEIIIERSHSPLKLIFNHFNKTLIFFSEIF